MIWKWQKVKKLEYEDIFKKLNDENIRYLLIGGAAVILYGVPRVTGDLDLMLEMSAGNLLKFIKAMNELGYKPKVQVKPEDFANPQKRKEWQEQKNMRVFSFMHPDDPFMLVDIMTNNPIDFEEAYSKRKVISMWGTKISLASKEHLIKLKEIAGRNQDLSDIVLLKQTEEKNNE